MRRPRPSRSIRLRRPISRPSRSPSLESNYTCILLPQITTEYEVGLLPPGTYTVREVDVDNPSSTLVLGTFLVAPAAGSIPALDFRGLAALAFMLTLAALIALSRNT